MLCPEDREFELYLEDHARIFYLLAHTVSKIKVQLLCSICLDIYETPTAVFNCPHIFCEKCIKTYLQYTTVRKPPCPICKIPIHRKYLQTRDSLLNVIEFVNSTEEELKELLSVNAIEKLSFNNIWNIIQRNRNQFTLPQQDHAIKPDYSELLKIKNIIVSANNEILSVDGTIPPEHLVPIMDLLKTPQITKPKPQVTQTPVKNTKINKDLFDTVKESGIDNPLCRSTRTYKKQKGKDVTNVNVNIDDSSYEFEDKSLKVDIIKWLTDNRNKFDHIATPEENVLHEVQMPDFDMPSVSQKHKPRLHVPPFTQINRQKLEQNRIRQKNKTITELTRTLYKPFGNNRRTQSLDCIVKNIKTEPRLKRHSITICESPEPEIIIDQYYSEDDVNIPLGKTAFVNLIEEEYINKIDSELQQKEELNKNANKEASPKFRNKLPSVIRQTIVKNNRKLVNLNTSSAWEPVNQIKKTIRKIDRKPRKLKVGEISYTNLTCTSASNSVIVVRGTTKVKASNHKERKSTIHETEPVAFDLNTFEEYCNKNKSILEPEKKRDLKKNVHKSVSTELSERKSCSSNTYKDLAIASTSGYNTRNKNNRIDNTQIKNKIIDSNLKRPTTSVDSFVKLKTKATAKHTPNSNVNITKDVSPEKLTKVPVKKQNKTNTNKNYLFTAPTVNKNKISRNTETGLQVKLGIETHPVVHLSRLSLVNEIPTPAQKVTITKSCTESVPINPTPAKQISLELDIPIVRENDNDDEEVNINRHPSVRVQPLPMETTRYTDDEVFMMPTQVNKPLLAQTESDSIEIDDDIFIKATQIVHVDTDSKQNHIDSIVTSLKEKISFLGGMFNDFKQNVPVISSNKSPIAHLHLTPVQEPDLLNNLKNILSDVELLILSAPIKETAQETRDIDIQTNDSKDIFSATISTQTSNHVKDASVQTDYRSPGGFRISSTAMFNIPTGITSAVQTDPLFCNHCRLELDVPKTVQLTSDTLSADTKLIQKLSNKYTLSTSFDNIDFDTQDVIKGKQIASTTTSKNTIEDVNFDATTNTEKLESPMVCSVNIIPQTCPKKVDPRKSFKRIRKPSSDSESEANPEVKEMPVKLKKNKFIEEDLSIHFDSDVPKEVPKNATADDHYIISSEGSDGINYKEVLDQIMMKYDDNDTNGSKHSNNRPVLKRTILKENNTQDSVINLEEPLVKKTKTQDIIRECEMIIQNACSETLQLEDTEKIPFKEPSKLTLALLEDEFGIKTSCFTTAQSVRPEKIPFKEPSKLTLAALEDEFGNTFSDCSEHADESTLKKKDTTPLAKKENTKDKFSESLFTDDNSSVLQNTELGTENKLNGTSKQSLNELIDKFNKGNDFFEEILDAEVAAINVDNKAAASEKCRILQDITVSDRNVMTNSVNPPDANVFYNKLKSKNTTPNNFDRSKSEEIFLSDSEVIETTPERHKTTSVEEIALFSQHYYNPDQPALLSSMEFSTSAAETCFIKPFTPPPEFQDYLDAADDIKNCKEDNINPAILISSLTPDLLLPENSQVYPLLERKLVTSTPLTHYSQIVSAYSVNLSPIKHVQENKSVNPLQAAQKSNINPLTLIQSKTPPKHLSPRKGTPRQKSILSYIERNDIISQYSPKTTNILQTNKKPCVACTRLNEEQLLAIISLSNKKLITYSKVFNSSVTHMIVAVNENQCTKNHTMKYVLAVASGIWVLGYHWIEECLRHGRIISEEPFEAFDVSGEPGPRQSRLNHTTNLLFNNIKIHAAPPFVSTTQKEVENVIMLLGGEVVPRPDDLLYKNGKICFIITESKGSQDFELYETWLESLGVVTVELEWLSRSVGQYQQQSLRPFALCSDDSISNLGYPPELVHTPLSFTQTTPSL